MHTDAACNWQIITLLSSFPCKGSTIFPNFIRTDVFIMTVYRHVFRQTCSPTNEIKQVVDIVWLQLTMRLTDDVALGQCLTQFVWARSLIVNKMSGLVHGCRAKWVWLFDLADRRLLSTTKIKNKNRSKRTELLFAKPRNPRALSVSRFTCTQRWWFGLLQRAAHCYIAVHKYNDRDSEHYSLCLAESCRVKHRIIIKKL